MLAGQMLLLLKLVLSPSLVTLASLGSRRYGPRFGGWLAGFPIVAGPVLLFFALEQGTPFAAAAAGSTLLGLVSLAMFCLVYGWAAATVAKPHRWYWALPVGWAVFAGFTALQVAFKPGPIWAFVLAVGALNAALLALPKIPGETIRVAPSAWDVPTRALSTAALVLTLTGLAHVLGPKVSGLLTPFPVASSILVVFAHKEGGPTAALSLLRGLLVGLQTFAGFCLVLAFALPAWGLAGAFAAGLLVSVALQFLVLQLFRR